MSGIDKMKNKAEELGGKGKEAVGDATDDRDLQAEGQKDQASGNLKQAGEKVKDAFKEALPSFRYRKLRWPSRLSVQKAGTAVGPPSTGIRAGSRSAPRRRPGRADRLNSAGSPATRPQSGADNAGRPA
jgi:uncharacterized protein YjbJ (UPF0337 family)